MVFKANPSRTLFGSPKRDQGHPPSVLAILSRLPEPRRRHQAPLALRAVRIPFWLSSEFQAIKLVLPIAPTSVAKVGKPILIQYLNEGVQGCVGTCMFGLARLTGRENYENFSFPRKLK